MLTVTGMHSYYGMSHVLHGVSLEVREGETVCLIGRNGAGKSTTLKSIVGLTPPRAGSVKLRGEELVGRRTHKIVRLGIGYVPEERRIFPNISVRDNLEIARRRPEKGSKWSLDRVFHVFPLLEKLVNRKGRELSGGEQQLLTVARSLMGDPDLLLIDEISEGLAPLVVQNLLQLVLSLKSELTMLLVEQNANFAFAAADRGYVIDKGEIKFHGTIEELRGNEEVKERYLAV